jgi:hypothetical protein
MTNVQSSGSTPLMDSWEAPIDRRGPIVDQGELQMWPNTYCGG